MPVHESDWGRDYDVATALDKRKGNMFTQKWFLYEFLRFFLIIAAYA